MTDNIQFDILTDYSAEAKLEKFDKDLAQLGIRLDDIKRRAEGLNRVSSALNRMARATAAANSAKLAEAKTALAIEKAELGVLKVQEQKLVAQDKLRKTQERIAANTSEQIKREKKVNAELAERVALQRALSREANLRATRFQQAVREPSFGSEGFAQTQAEFAALTNKVDKDFDQIRQRIKALRGPLVVANDLLQDSGIYASAFNSRLARAANSVRAVSTQARRLVAPIARASQLITAASVNAGRLTRQFIRSRIAASQAAAATQRLQRNVSGSRRSMRLFNGTVFRSIKSVTALAALFTGIQGVVAQTAFADQLQKAEPQIAGLISSTGRLLDINGKLVEPVAAYEKSLSTARGQVQLLQKDALKTAATFSDLLENFQVAVGPGLGVGLNIDQIRELTVTISQAATALGIGQEQLAEEVRSLFTGAINPRNSRIATALQITPEDIKRVQQSGEQFTFLQGKLAGIAEASKDLQGTLTVAFSNVQDALLQAGVSGIEPFRKALLRLASTLRSDNGVSAFSDLIGGIGESLAIVVDGVNDFIKGLEPQTVQEFSDGLKASAEIFVGLGSAVSKLTIAVLPAFVDILQAVSAALDKTSGATDFLARILTVTAQDIGKAAKALGRGFGLDIPPDLKDGLAETSEESSKFLEALTELRDVEILAPALRGLQELQSGVDKAAAKVEDFAKQAKNLSSLETVFSELLGKDLGTFDLSNARKEVADLQTAFEEASKRRQAAAREIRLPSNDTDTLKIAALVQEEAQARAKLVDGQRQLKTATDKVADSEQKILGFLVQQQKFKEVAANQEAKRALELQRLETLLTTSGASSEDVSQQVEFLRLAQERQKIEEEIAKTISDGKNVILKLGGNQTLFGRIAQQTLNIRLDTLRTDREILELSQKLTADAKARAILEERARTQTGAGLQRGLENQQLGDGEIAQNFVGDAVGALRGGLQGALRDAFDPNSNTDLGQSLLLIGQNIAFALGDALLEQFVIQPLIDSLAASPEDVAKDVALTANTLALDRLTAAISAQAVTAGAATGLASGGPIPGANLRSAPRGLPSTDRTLIAATPGEFMLRKSSSEYLGKDFLSALNRDPSIIDPYLGRNRKIPGYAAGGSIGDSSPSRAIKTSSSSSPSTAPPQQILVVSTENARAMFSSSQFDVRAAQSAKIQRLTER